MDDRVDERRALADAARRVIRATRVTEANADELTSAAALLEQAATSLRAAMKAFDRGARPYEWATTRSRLGDVLWARGLALADPQLVAEAIDAKTAALDELDALDRQDEAAQLRGELERMQHDSERLTPVEPPDQAESA